MQKKLRLSKENNIIAGVCGGIGEFLNIDPSIIRLIWIIFIFFSDSPAIFAYLICMIIIPDPEPYYSEDINKDTIDQDDDYVYSENKTKNSSLIVGLGLIAIGVLLLAKRIWPTIFNFYRFRQYWPVLLVLLGLYIIFKKTND